MTVRRDHTVRLTVDTQSLIAKGLAKPDFGDVRLFLDPGRTISAPYEIDQTTVPGLASLINAKISVPAGEYLADLQNYWPFDGDPNDPVGAANGTLVNSPTFAPGQVGEAIWVVAASSQRVDIPASVSSALDGESAATFETWLSPASLASTTTFFLLTLNAAATAKVQLETSSTGQIFARARSRSADSLQSVVTTPTIPLNRWSHVVVVVDIGNDAITVYIDGVLATTTGTVSFGVGVWQDGSGTVQAIGSDASASHFDGRIDNFALYHRALTADEVYSSYLRGRNKKLLQEPTPTWAVSMDSDDNAGSEVVDVKSGQNGTINGTVTTGQAGRVGEAFDFDGSTGFVEVADDPLLEPHVGASGTSTWVTTLNADPSANRLTWLSKIRGDTNQREFFLSIEADGVPRIAVFDPTDTNRLQIDSLVPIPRSAEVHLAVTYDAAETGLDRFGVFIDGIRAPLVVADSAGTFTQMTSGSEAVRVGKRIDGGGSSVDFFDGTISEILWTSDVLADADILTLARRSREGLRPDLEAAFLSNAIAYWSFDDADIGITPQDQIGTNHPTVTGPLLVGQAGPTGGSESVEFDGATAYLTAPDNTVFDAHLGTSGVMTLTKWLFVASAPVSDLMVLMKGEPAAEEFQYLIDASNGGAIQTFFTDPNFSNFIEVSSVDPVPFGEWFHLSLVYDAAQATQVDKVKLFLNGLPFRRTLASSAGSYTGMTGSTDVLAIGVFNPASFPALHFDGRMSKLRYFGQALTAEQVRDLYEKEAAGLDYRAEAQRIYLAVGDPDRADASDPANTWINPSIPSAVTGVDMHSGALVDDIGSTVFSPQGEVLDVVGKTGRARGVRGKGTISSDLTLPSGDKSLLFRFRTTNANQVLLADYDGGLAASGLALRIASGFLEVRHNESNVTLVSTATVNDGAWHTALVTLADGGSIELFVDSDSADDSDTAADTVAPPSFVRIGAYTIPVYTAPSGEVLRLEADSIDPGSDVDADGRVFDWPDASSSSNDGGQNNASDRPLYVPEGMGGQPAVEFFQDWAIDLDSTIDLSSSNFTVFAVFQLKEDVDSATTECRLLGSVSSAKGIALGATTGLIANEVLDVFETSGSARHAAITGITVPHDLPTMLVVGLSGDVEDFRLGGTDQGAPTEANGGLDSNSGNSLEIDRIGNNASQTAPGRFQLAALLVFSDRLSGADTTFVERYLALKYGAANSAVAGDTWGNFDVDTVKVWDRKLTPSEVTALLGSPDRYAEPNVDEFRVRNRIDPEIVTVVG